MLKVERMETGLLKTAILGMRNPMESWAKLDSDAGRDGVFKIGPNDLSLAQKLCKAGPEHRKFLRQIKAGMDITAPLYWWKQMDQYKAEMTTDSTSTMHTLGKGIVHIGNFSHEGLSESGKECLEATISRINECAVRYRQGGPEAEGCWDEMIKLLPSCYNQMRTVTTNYETILNIIRQRQKHKLAEWAQFIEAMRGLPYADGLLFFDEEGREM